MKSVDIGRCGFHNYFLSADTSTCRYEFEDFWVSISVLKNRVNIILRGDANAHNQYLEVACLIITT